MYRFSYVSGFALLLLSTAVFAQSPAKTSSAPASTGITAPMAFAPMAAQPSSAGIDYTSNGAAYGIALNSRFAELALVSKVGRDRRTSAPGQPEFIRMSLLGGAESRASAEGLMTGKVNRFSGNDPSKWQTDLPTYSRVRYNAVYPGVDVAYYGSQNRLEYDFLVAPHAGTDAIRLQFQGADIRQDKSGNLLLKTHKGTEIEFDKPTVYQKNADGSRTRVDGSYRLAGKGTVQFQVGAYDHSRELVIDPVLSYASFIGGNEYDEVYGSAVSPQGYLYITGYTYYYQNSGAVIYPTTAGAFQTTCTWCLYGQSSAFVTKFSGNGSSLIYSTFLEGSYKGTQCAGQCPGSTMGNAIAVSVDDQAYVFGTTFSEDFPTVNPIQAVCRPNYSNQQTCQIVYGGEAAGNGSFFITRLNSAGNGLLYSTFFGNNSGGYPTSIALDQNKNIIISGSAYGAFPCPGNCGNGANLPITTNGYEATFTTDQAVPFISELSANGQSLLYSTWLGGNTFCDSGNGTCQAYPGQAVAANGLIYTVGSTEASDFPVTSNAYQGSCAETTGNPPNTCLAVNGYLAIFNPSATTGAASAKTVTYIHGPTSGQAVYLQGVAVDPSGNIFVTGSTNDQAFPVTTTNGIAFSFNVPASYIIAKMNPTGTSLLKSAWMGDPPGGTIGQQPTAVTTDSIGNVYSSFNNGNPGVTGSAIPLVNPVQSTQPGQDLVLAEQSNDLSTVLFSTYMGGSATITPEGISLDAARNIYAAGETGYQGADFITTSGAYQTTFPGGEVKGIVEKISGIYPATTTTVGISPTTLYANTTATITVTVTGASGTPTGNVALYGDGALIGTYTLSGGKLSLKVAASYLGTGAHTAEAIYLGSSTYGGSMGALAGQIYPDGTKTALSVTPTTIPNGGTVTATATVTRQQGTGYATGTVNFLADGQFVASANLVNGVATFSHSTAGFTPGTYNVTAAYQGDSTDTSSTSPAVSVTLQ